MQKYHISFTKSFSLIVESSLDTEEFEDIITGEIPLSQLEAWASSKLDFIDINKTQNSNNSSVRLVVGHDKAELR